MLSSGLKVCAGPVFYILDTNHFIEGSVSTYLPATAYTSETAGKRLRSVRPLCTCPLQTSSQSLSTSDNMLWSTRLDCLDKGEDKFFVVVRYYILSIGHILSCRRYCTSDSLITLFHFLCRLQNSFIRCTVSHSSLCCRYDISDFTHTACIIS